MIRMMATTISNSNRENPKLLSLDLEYLRESITACSTVVTPFCCLRFASEIGSMVSFSIVPSNFILILLLKCVGLFGAFCHIDYPSHTYYKGHKRVRVQRYLCEGV